MDHADLADKQIEDDLRQAIFRCGTQTRAKARQYTHCVECDAPIPKERSSALPGVRLCVICAGAQERRAAYSARPEMRLDNWLPVE